MVGDNIGMERTDWSCMDAVIIESSIENVLCRKSAKTNNNIIEIYANRTF